MNIIYGNSTTYLYKIDPEDLKWLIDRTNRSKGQTEFLFQLVDGDFDKLKLLEKQIKNNHYIYCPENNDDVNMIMMKKSKNEWFKL